MSEQDTSTTPRRRWSGYSLLTALLIALDLVVAVGYAADRRWGFAAAWLVGAAFWVRVLRLTRGMDRPVAS